jgi:hypothetical protein
MNKKVTLTSFFATYRYNYAPCRKCVVAVPGSAILLKRKNISDVMKDHSNPFKGIAKFLITLGLIMIAAKTDLLGLGSISDYFRWEMLLLFFGLFNLLSLDLVGSVLLFAAGYWFLMPDMSVQLSPFYKTIYWPSVLVMVGIAYMIRPFTKSLK